jgi:hypothetical protein
MVSLASKRRMAQFAQRVARGDIERTVNIDERTVEIEKDCLEFAPTPEESFESSARGCPVT